MLLAGVVMKLGAYGCLRVAMTLFPEGMEAWKYFIAVLATIGIIYGAMVALVQKDFKFVIGYSSVSQMGFVLLGLMTLNTIGLSGAVLQMFSHGIIAGLLFAVVGRMVYERTHTRELDVLETMGLSKAMPFAAVTFVIASMASMGLPGFSGFVAELQIIIGAWQAFPTLAVITGIGILIGVAYTLRGLQKAFLGESDKTLTPTLSHLMGEGEVMEPISVPERLGAVMLIATALAIGLFPRLLLDVIVPSFDSPLFDWLRNGGAR
jgi:NADH-quinone oxidoreductase subunit M